MVKRIDIAKALGMSAAAVTKHAKAGMPTTSIEAATKWHAQNVDPVRSVGQSFGRGSRGGDAAEMAARALAAVAHLAELARVDFERHEASLRRALRLVPRVARDRVMLDVEVWSRLIDIENLKRWEQLVVRWDLADGIPQSSPAELDEAVSNNDHAHYLYEIASGDIQAAHISQADLDRA
jgi:hypothetical protein